MDLKDLWGRSAERVPAELREEALAAWRRAERRARIWSAVAWGAVAVALACVAYLLASWSA